MPPRAARLDPRDAYCSRNPPPPHHPHHAMRPRSPRERLTPLGLAPPAYSRSQVQPLPWRRPRDASAAAHSTPLSRANPSDRPPSLTRVLAPPARISATSRECQDSVSAAARATRALACTYHRGHHLQPLLDSLQEFIRSTCSNSSSCRPPVTSSCSSSLLRRRLLTSRCALICSG